MDDFPGLTGETKKSLENVISREYPQCPSSIEKARIQGTSSNVKSTSFGVDIVKCLGKSTCKPYNEIHKWKEDVQFFVITLSEKFNQNQYGEKPIYFLFKNTQVINL